LEEEDDPEGGAAVDEGALMAALQKNLAAAGGPLSGMDPQQLLQFAMRMMNDQDAGDDIAGELADNLLAQDQEDEDEEADDDAPADLMDWLSKSRAPADSTPSGSISAPSATFPIFSKPKPGDKQPPTPPSSEATRSYVAIEDGEQKAGKVTNAAAFKRNNDSMDMKQEVTNNRKRKLHENIGANNAGSAPKKRATPSFDAPTAASRAKAAPAPAPAKTRSSTRSKRS
jgi:hypothetical protein